MTEKRFTSKDYNVGYYTEINDNGSRLLINEVVDLLNEQHEENEQLKSKIERLQYDLEHKQNHLNQLLKNPLLTDILQQAPDILRINTELENENEQLKQRISELELLNDGLNYALKNIKQIDVEIDVGDLND